MRLLCPWDWVAIFFSGVSSQPRDWTQVFCIAGRFFTAQPSGKPHTSVYVSLLFFDSLFRCTHKHPYLSPHSIHHEKSLYCRSVHCQVLGRPVGYHTSRIFHNYSFFLNLYCWLKVMVLLEHLWLDLSSESPWFILFLDLKIENCLFRFINNSTKLEGKAHWQSRLIWCLFTNILRRAWQPTPVLLPRQYRGAWWAAIHRVTLSWTWLKWLSSSSSTNILKFLKQPSI